MVSAMLSLFLTIVGTSSAPGPNCAFVVLCIAALVVIKLKAPMIVMAGAIVGVGTALI